jgi:hypothetical protein
VSVSVRVSDEEELEEVKSLPRGVCGSPKLLPPSCRGIAGTLV